MTHILLGHMPQTLEDPDKSFCYLYAEWGERRRPAALFLLDPMKIITEDLPIMIADMEFKPGISSYRFDSFLNIFVPKNLVR
jgi:hypothetical protein